MLERSLTFFATASLVFGCGDSGSGTRSQGGTGGAVGAAAVGGTGLAGMSAGGASNVAGRSTSTGGDSTVHGAGTMSGSGTSDAGTSAAGASGGSTSGAGPGHGGATVGAGGASGDDAGGTPSGDAGEPAGGAANDGGDLFTNPLVPHCDDGTYMNYEVRGTVNGQPVNLMTSLSSSLQLHSFQVLEIDGSAIVEPLVLTWTESLSEDTAVPLTGASIMLGAQSYCVTAGSFGSPTRTVESGNPRPLLFRITGLRVGDCSGPAVDADLGGCVSRDAPYFPRPGEVPIFDIDPSRPDLPADKHITDLTDDEKAELCDWMALEEGGYDHVTECAGPGGSTTITAKDQAQCLSIYLAHPCPWDTVGSVVICKLTEAPTHHCEMTEECANMLSCR